MGRGGVARQTLQSVAVVLVLVYASPPPNPKATPADEASQPETIEEHNNKVHKPRSKGLLMVDVTEAGPLVKSGVPVETLRTSEWQAACIASSIVGLFFFSFAWTKKGEFATVPNWLLVLVMLNLSVLSIQVTLGVLTGSQEMQADVVNTAVDCMTYLLSLGAEHIKKPLPEPSNQRSIIDASASFISISALLVGSFVIGTDAINDIRSGGAKGGSFALLHHDPRGLAMIAFALMTLLVNGLMVLLYKHWGLTIDPHGDDELLAKPVEMTAGEEDQLLPAELATEDTDDWEAPPAPGRQENHLQQLPVIEENRARTARGSRAGSLLGSIDPIQGPDPNLNLSASLLHLISDLAGALTVLVSGLAVTSGVLSPGFVDCAGALFMASFNILGSLALLQHILLLCINRESDSDSSA